MINTLRYCMCLVACCMYAPLLQAQDQPRLELPFNFQPPRPSSRLLNAESPTSFRPMEIDDVHRWDALDTSKVVFAAKYVTDLCKIKVGDSYRYLFDTKKVILPTVQPSKFWATVQLISQSVGFSNPMPIAKQAQAGVMESIYSRSGYPHGARLLPPNPYLNPEQDMFYVLGFDAYTMQPILIGQHGKPGSKKD